MDTKTLLLLNSNDWNTCLNNYQFDLGDEMEIDTKGLSDDDEKILAKTISQEINIKYSKQNKDDDKYNTITNSQILSSSIVGTPVALRTKLFDTKNRNMSVDEKNVITKTSDNIDGSYVILDSKETYIKRHMNVEEWENHLKSKKI